MLKKFGIALLFIPVIFVLLFTLGEISSAEMSVLPHLLQLALLAFLIVLAIKRTLVGGILLIVVSMIGGILYAINVPSLEAILIVESLLFIPPFISGILLIFHTKKFV